MKTLTSILALFILTLFGCKRIDKKHDLVWVESTCSSLSKIEFNIHEINQGMELRGLDSLWSIYWREAHQQQMDILKKVQNNKFALFPYQKVDSALIYFYEPAAKVDQYLSLDSRQIKDVSQLCSQKIQLLLNVINNPLNFGVGECGTNIHFSKIVLFNNGNEIASVVFGCGYSMISTTPNNPMITGGLTERGDSLLNSIKIWE